MFMLKGFGLGLAIFVVFTLAYFRACGILGRDVAVTKEAFSGLVTANYLYWTATALIFALGFVLAALWPIKTS